MSTGKASYDSRAPQGDDDDVSLRQLIQSGRSFSGRERNCCFLNLRDGRFADVSAVLGLDLTDDGRGLALTDWDGDGDLDIWMVNRSGPQLKLLRNDLPDKGYLAIQLVGSRSNRDAIGARVKVEIGGTATESRIRSVRAGDAFLSQTTKWLHFGLRDGQTIDRVVVQWPGQSTEVFSGLTRNRRYCLVEGSGIAEPVESAAVSLKSESSDVSQPESRRRILFEPRIPFPSLPFETADGRKTAVSQTGQRNKPLFINLWVNSCAACQEELAALGSAYGDLSPVVDILCLNVEAAFEPANDGQVRKLLEGLRRPFDIGLADAAAVDVIRIVHDFLIDVHQPLSLPTSLLIDEQGQLVAMYVGTVSVEQLKLDAELMAASNQGQSVTYGLPFPGRYISGISNIRLELLPHKLIQGGYPEIGIDYALEHGLYAETDGEFARLLVWRGEQLLAEGNFLEAERRLRAAIHIDPSLTQRIEQRLNNDRNDGRYRK